MNIIDFPPIAFHADADTCDDRLRSEREGKLITEDGGWMPAGLLGTEGNLAIVSKLTGTLIEFNPERFTERATLLSLGPRAVLDYSDYCDKAKREVFRGSWLAETMQEHCVKLGPLNPESVRGPGIYRDGDGIVINTGKRVFKQNGQPVDLTPKRGGHIYVAGDEIGIDPRGRLASSHDIEAFVEALRSFNYARPHDYRLMAGWLVMATLAQALETRPSVQLSADRACGKTTMITLLSHVLGNQLVVREGVPTKAQVLYEMQGRCAALAIDECEPSGGGSKAIDAVAELARTGFTGGKSSGYTRVIGGKSRRFNAPTGVLFAAIALPALNPATESRTVRIDLLPLAARRSGSATRSWLLDPSRAADVEALGRRLRSLIVLRWPVIQDCYERLFAILDGIGHDRRQSAKFATLLACWLGLTNKRAPKDADLRTLVAEHGLSTTAEEQEESEAYACLEHLLQHYVTVHRVIGDKHRREDMSIRAVIAAVADKRTPDAEALARQLHEVGLRVFLDELTNDVTLAVSSSRRTLKLAKLYERTDWARGGWKHVLARLPGAHESFARVSPAKPARVVKLPLSAEQLDVRFDASLYAAAA